MICFTFQHSNVQKKNLAQFKCLTVTSLFGNTLFYSVLIMLHVLIVITVNDA